MVSHVSLCYNYVQHLLKSKINELFLRIFPIEKLILQSKEYSGMPSSNKTYTSSNLKSKK